MVGGFSFIDGFSLVGRSNKRSYKRVVPFSN